jgi:hypothetical protein
MPKFKIKFSPKAAIEIQAAIYYYDSVLPGLAGKFYKDFKSQIAIISVNPYVKAIRYDDVRFANLKKIPYSVHYQIVGQIVYVIAVLSRYQDPNTAWRSNASE